MVERLLEQNYRGVKVLVTGDTGFKGSWLSLFLHELGAQVAGYGLDPLNADDNYVVCNCAKTVEHTTGDIRDFKRLSRVIEDVAPQYIFHLAAQPLVQQSYREPRETFETNVLGTANLLDAARGMNCIKSIVVVTSDKCYENREWLYGYRETDRLGGKDPYSASKAAAEIITASYRSSYCTSGELAPVATVRAGNVIGGGDWSDDRIVPDCMRALIAGKPIILRNPDAVRPWQHVLEPLYGYCMLGAHLGEDGARYSGAWNFGPDRSGFTTVGALVNMLVEQWGEGTINSTCREGYKPEAGMLCLDISKTVMELGWHPRYDIQTAVSNTVEEYRCVRKTPHFARENRIARIQSYLAAMCGDACMSEECHEVFLNEN